MTCHGLTPRTTRRPAFRKPKIQTAYDEWRCTGCATLLGRVVDGHLHLKFARNHYYIVPLPACATCKGCGTLNSKLRPPVG
jgi:hypothetical protein